MNTHRKPFSFRCSLLRKLSRALACLPLLFALTGRVTAALITFDSLDIDHLVLAGPQVEAAFQYQATSGMGWEVQTLYGNPTSALVTFFNVEGSSNGDTVAITRVGGGLFTFNSVDFATVLAHQSDQVVLTGFLGGNPTGSMALNISTPSPNAFVTLPSSFAGPIDLLRVQVSFAGENAMLLDNFNVASVVPEPASMVLLGMAGLTLLGYRRAPSAAR